MKRFTYKAKEQGSSKVIKGTIQAESERAAGKLLMDRGYIPESSRDEADGKMKSIKVSAHVYALVCDFDWCRFAVGAIFAYGSRAN